MQARRRHVHPDILVGRDLHVAPLSSGEGVTGIDVGFGVIEAQSAPFDSFHIFRF